MSDSQAGEEDSQVESYAEVYKHAERMSWVEAKVEHEEGHLNDTMRCIDDDFLDEGCLHAESEQVSCWRPGAVEVLLLEARETGSYSFHSLVYRRTISSEINKLQRQRRLTCHNPGSRTAAEQPDERCSQPTRSHISPAQHTKPLQPSTMTRRTHKNHTRRRIVAAPKPHHERTGIKPRKRRHDSRGKRHVGDAIPQSEPIDHDGRPSARKQATAAAAAAESEHPHRLE
jgi:hypothetical protein